MKHEPIAYKSRLGRTGGARTIACLAVGAWLVTSIGALAQTVINVPPDPAPSSVSGDTILNLSAGGVLKTGFAVNVGATVNVSGGTIGDLFKSFIGSTVQMSGFDFAVDGVLVPGLENVGNLVQLNVSEGQIFSGIFSDGTPFVFTDLDEVRLPRLGDLFANGSLTLVRSAVPSPGPALIDVPSDTAPQGVRNGQTLRLADGGELGEHFNAGLGSVVNIEGGTVGGNFEAFGAEINISGGNVGRDMDAFGNSTVNISGGNVESEFEVFEGSTVNISGGVVGNQNVAWAGSTVNISGGSVGFFSANGAGSTLTISDGAVDRITSASGGTVNISGGSVGSDKFPDPPFSFVNHAFGGSPVNISGGNVGAFELRGQAIVNISGGTLGDRFFINTSATFPPGTVTISGSDFALDGVPIDGLENPGNTVPLNGIGNQLFSGTFADGTPFAFSGFDTDRLADGWVDLIRVDPPALGAALIHLPSDPVPLGIRGGQTLRLVDGGALANNFNAGPGSVVNIEGGIVGRNFEAVGAEVNISGGTVGSYADAYLGSIVNISGGSVGQRFDALSGATVNISGGTVGGSFEARFGSTVNISGGELAGAFKAKEGSIVNISGGNVGDSFRASFDSTVTITGGIVGERFSAFPGSVVTISGGSIGDGFKASADSMIEIIGFDFLLDGSPINGLADIGDSLILTERGGSVLSGRLLDGTPFDFELNSDVLSSFIDEFDTDATLQLTLVVPEPGTFVLALMGAALCLAAARCRRRKTLCP